MHGGAKGSGAPLGNQNALKHGMYSGDTRALEKTLSDDLGLKVDIQDQAGAGRLTIQYKSLEQLDEVIRRLLRG